MMAGTSNKALTLVVEQAKANPIPIALIGVGIAWWALGQRRGGQDDYDAYSGQGYYETYEGYDEDGAGGKLKARARAAKAKVAELAAQAKDAIGHAGAGAGERAGSVKERLSGLAGAAQARAGEAGQRVRQGIEAEPLILAAIGLAVGAAIGASLPSTAMERRYVGPARDKALARGRDLARDSLDDAKGIAQRAYDQAKAELHRQTGADGEGSSLREKAQKIAEAGVQTVRDEVEGRVQH